MTSPSSIGRIIPPIVTPLLDRDTLDVDGLERLIHHLVDGGVDGIFVLGTTGEGPSLSHQLQREMVEFTSRILGNRLPLYVGITSTSLVEALDLSRVGAEAGAEAVVAAPPFYFPAGQTELRHWFHQLVADLPLPVLLYNIPSCTKISIESGTLESLIEIDSVIGLKDSSGDLSYLKQSLAIARDRRPDWPILVGPEHLLAEAISLGAAGGVPGGANLVPRLFVSLVQAVEHREAEEIARLQGLVKQLQELYSIGKYGSAFLKGVKCALELRGICSGQLAAPFDAFREPERERVATWLDSFAPSGLLPDSPHPSLSVS